MRKKLFFVVTLQVTCVVAFALMALACKSTAVVTANETKRAPHSTCESGDYLFIGTPSSNSEATSVANLNHFNDACKDDATGRYFAK